MIVNAHPTVENLEIITIPKPTLLQSTNKIDILIPQKYLWFINFCHYLKDVFIILYNW